MRGGAGAGRGGTETGSGRDFCVGGLDFRVMYLCIHRGLNHGVLSVFDFRIIYLCIRLCVADEIMSFSNAPGSEGKAGQSGAEARQAPSHVSHTPTLPQPACSFLPSFLPSFFPSFPPSRPGANARSRERLGEAPPGQSGGLSAGAPRSRARPGADLELRRPAWKLTRSFLPSPSIQARSEGRPPTPHPHTRLCSGGELRRSPVWRPLSRHTHTEGKHAGWLAGWLAGGGAASPRARGRQAGSQAGPGTPIPLRAALAESGRPSSHTAWECGPSTGRFPSPSDRALSSLARSLARGRPWRFVHTPGRARSPLPGGPGSPRSEGGRQARAELRQVTPHPPEIHTRKRRVMISSGDD